MYAALWEKLQILLDSVDSEFFLDAYHYYAWDAGNRFWLHFSCSY